MKRSLRREGTSGRSNEGEAKKKDTERSININTGNANERKLLVASLLLQTLLVYMFFDDSELGKLYRPVG